MNGEDIGKRLRELREKAGLTQEGLADKSGVSQGIIAHYELGTRRFTEKTLEVILNALDPEMTYEEFFTSIPNVEKTDVIIFPGKRKVPVISWVHAGEFKETVDMWPVGVSGEGEPVEPSKRVGPNSFALIVKGDSMEPRFHDGDIIVVDPAIEVQVGDFCVAKVNDDVTFKKLARRDDEEIRIVALNKKYPPIVIEKDSLVRFYFVGKVIDMIPKLY